MFAPRYFPVRYFAPRYWPPGAAAPPAANIVLTTLAGRELTIFADEVIAVEEQITLVGDPVYRGVRSRVYLADRDLIVRSTASDTITEVQTVDAFTATIAVTTVEGREITALAASVAAVEEQVTDVRSPIYTGVRSRMFLESHIVDVRLSAADLITAIQAVVAFTATIVVTTVEGREATILAAEIAAVVEQLTDVRSTVYTGVRSRLFMGPHIIDPRLTADALITLIEAA